MCKMFFCLFFKSFRKKWLIFRVEKNVFCIPIFMFYINVSLHSTFGILDSTHMILMWGVLRIETLAYNGVRISAYKIYYFNISFVHNIKLPSYSLVLFGFYFMSNGKSMINNKIMVWNTEKKEERKTKENLQWSDSETNTIQNETYNGARNTSKGQHQIEEMYIWRLRNYRRPKVEGFTIIHAWSGIAVDCCLVVYLSHIVIRPTNKIQILLNYYITFCFLYEHHFYGGVFSIHILSNPNFALQKFISSFPSVLSYFLSVALLPVYCISSRCDRHLSLKRVSFVIVFSFCGSV